jgi:hypothetical protein
MTPCGQIPHKFAKPLSLLTLLSCIITAPVVLAGETVVETINFDNISTTKEASGWFIGSQSGGKTSIETDPLRPGKSLRAQYPIAEGGMYNWAGFDISEYNSYEIIVEFDARMPTPQGIKFFKIFGQSSDATGYANTTFGLVSDSDRPGTMTQISFGDGTISENDVANVVNLGGEHPEWVGRAWNKGAKVYTGNTPWLTTDWKDTWHHFYVRAKFNTGSCVSGKPSVPEVNDGAYKLVIDGKTFVDATGLFNRNCKNMPIRNIDFFDWGQNGTKPFEVWLDNIKISVVTPDATSSGTSSQPTTQPPANDPLKTPNIISTQKTP